MGLLYAAEVQSIDGSHENHRSRLLRSDDTDHPHFLSGNVPGDLFSLKFSRSLVFKRSRGLNNA